VVVLTFNGEMDWLKNHSYLATWISPCIAIAIAIVRSKGKLSKVDWHEFVGILVLLTAIAVVFTPVFDTRARQFASTLVYFLFGYGVLRVTQNRK
jgi:hypothetical protein